MFYFRNETRRLRSNLWKPIFWSLQLEKLTEFKEAAHRLKICGAICDVAGADSFLNPGSLTVL